MALQMSKWNSVESLEDNNKLESMYKDVGMAQFQVPP